MRRVAVASWPAVPTLVGGTAVLLVAWFLARTSSVQTQHGVALALLAMAAALIVAVAVSRWRVGLYFFLVWLVLEDLPRKFLGNDLLVYFGKDILAAAVLLGFVLEWRTSRAVAFRPPFLVPLLLFAAVCCVEILNPNSPSLLYGLLGIKLYLYYVPLVFLGYGLIESERDLRRFLIFNLALAAVVAGLGIVQAVVGAGFLNPAITPQQLNLLRLVRRAPLTGELVPRPTSVFVSDGRFVWYMLLALFLSLGTTVFGVLRRDRRIWVSLVTLALTVVAILLSGSRGGFVYALVTGLIFAPALIWGLGQGAAARRPLARAIGTFGVIAAGAVLATAVLFPDTLGARWAFYYQTIAPWSPASELAYRAGQYPVAGFLMAFHYPQWPLGYGIGTSALGVEYLTSVFQLPMTGAEVESGYGSLVVEMGIPGLITWLAWTISLIWAAGKVVRQLRGSPLFPVGFAILWFAFVLLFPLTYGGIQPYQNFVFNVFLWLLVGVLFRLPRLLPQPIVVLQGVHSGGSS